MTRPSGTLGFITAPDCHDRLAVMTDAGCYFAPNWHDLDDWHYCPGASFRERGVECDDWCREVAEDGMLCADCARQAFPDLDRDAS